MLQKNRLYLYSIVFGGLAFALLAMVAFTTVRNAVRDKALIMQNALTQGYWIARSLEFGHSMMMQNHTEAMRDLIQSIETGPDIRFVLILDADARVMIATDRNLEGRPWPTSLGRPPETGRVLKQSGNHLDLAYPAFFAQAFQRMPHPHGHHNGELNNAKWILLGLDAAASLAHYRDIVWQSVFLSGAIVLLGLGAFVFFGMIQKYQLANASLEQLEHIKRQLARFVPGTVQRLIEENPHRPPLEKAERDATVLFLDIDHYTQLSEDVSPELLNRLIERYFAAFLDIILSHGGDINETAGDAIMAIFTARSRRTHALNAVKAAMAIQKQARALNEARRPADPEIQVNIGINTGQVLLGATMMKGTVGERFTYTASGMTTNIASRLCDLAHHGDIKLSNATAQLVQEQIALQGPVEAQLKNVSGTVQVYTLA